MARTKKSEEEKKKELQEWEDRINSFKESISEYDYKKFIKVCDSYPIDPEEGFKLLIDKFVKGEVKFTATTTWN